MKAIDEKNIAWQGWTIPVREEWQPIRIEGDFHRGRMIVGNSDGPVFQISWQRPDNIDNFDCPRWLAKQTARFNNGKVDTVKSDNCSDLEITSIEASSKDGNEKKNKRVWWAYSIKSGIVVEISMPNLAAEHEQKFVINKSVPGLECYAKDENTQWRIYDISFSVPPGYVLKNKHLYSGDIALEFHNDKKERLLLRQIYPAKLALSRRIMQRWLKNASPFKRHRKYKSLGQGSYACSNFEGMFDVGWQKIPFPFGFIKPMNCRKVAVVDKELDRLLIAEHMSSGDVESTILEDSVLQMNTEVRAG